MPEYSRWYTRCSNLWVVGSGCGQVTLNEELYVRFVYEGLEFHVLKNVAQCETCAMQFSRRLFDQFSRGLLRIRRDNFATTFSVKWKTYLSEKRKWEGAKAGAIPAFDRSQQMLQVLHDIGVLSLERESMETGRPYWQIINKDEPGNVIPVGPIWYDGRPLFFKRKDAAIEFARVCLNRSVSASSFLISNGREFIDDSEILFEK